MIRLYDLELSGNCHKVRLMLSLLGLEYDRVPVDFGGGEHKSPQFLQLNPLGEIPVLVDGEVVLRDSQAILVYLARRYGNEDWLPLEAEPMSRVVQWLSTAANDIRQGPEFARLYHLFGFAIDIQLASDRSYAILNVLDDHLHAQSWLAGDRPTIADIACFPYVGLAADGKISLEAYPNVRGWIDRLKQLPGYVGMPGL